MALVPGQLNLSEEDREILNDFLTEGRESLEEVEPLLIQLEDKVGDADKIDSNIINKIFRAFHSLKGSAGFIGLTLTAEVTHHAETLLDLIRKDKLPMQKAHIDIFLKLCDFFMSLFENIESSESELGFEDDAATFVEDLEYLISGDVTEAQAPAPVETIETSQQTPELEELITGEMISQFVQDARELLETVEQELLGLEKEPDNKEHVESAFRALHSLKGNAGFFGYTDISAICHKAESFLDDVRCGKADPQPEQISMILQAQDFLLTAVDNLSAGKSGEIAGKSGLLDLMGEMFADDTAEPADETPAPVEPPKPVPAPAPEPVKAKPTADIPPKPQAKPQSGSADKTPKKSVKSKDAGKSNEVIRVDVGRLNTLMDLVGEIVIAESMVAQHPDIAGTDMPEFEKSIIHLQKNIRELQELSTSMRMIPLTALFRKMIRLVRDLSNKSKKKVDLEIIGGDTEVDRSVIEHISDPLVHIIRNSVDHGIESTEERKLAKKTPIGKVRLEAKQVGAEIWISISEDGRGLDREKILKKAREKGIVANGAELSDDEINKLIFAPGFSTADKVTDISGRGVGMDVVLKNIEKIRGKVDVSTTPGVGTTFTLRIPLTTAIVDGMLLRVKDSIYAVPVLDIKESLKIADSNIVEMVDGQEVVKIRESFYPVVRIAEIHDLTTEKKDLTDGILVLVENGGKSLCLFVDELIDQKQLVIKPLPDYLGELEGVSGCAILGDGDICLIFDIANLIKLAESGTKV